MRRRRWLWVFSGAVVVVVALAAYSRTGSRAEVAVDSVLPAREQLSAESAGWKVYARHDGDGESLREWSGPSGAFLHEEASARGGAFGGRYYYVSADPARSYGKDFPGLVREADRPDHIGADAAKLFCGNVGRSAADAFDDCQIWGYWARYGQYVAYLELRSRRLTQDEFTAMAKRFDTAMSTALPKT